MTDLRTTYLGLHLRSPIVASAGPLTRERETAERLEAAGAGAIVLPSLFEEEIVHDEVELSFALEAGSEAFPEALDYFPPFPVMESVLGNYLASIGELKDALDIPVIASLNGTTTGGWIDYAQKLAGAGADALELNLYRLAADAEQTAADVEARDLRLIADVVAAVDLPVAIKLGPYYTAMANFARQVAATGARGLVLFNRFYQPDLDLETRDVLPRIDLSQPWELRLPLRWIAILRPVLGTAVSLAATSGVAAPRTRAHRDARGRVAGLDDRPRLRVGGAAPRQRQHRHQRRPRGLRASQLPAHAPLVDDAPEPRPPTTGTGVSTPLLV